MTWAALSAARRRLLAGLARKPTAQCIVGNCCRLVGSGLGVESEKSDGSPFHPAHFTPITEEAEVSITKFENAQ
jgi:hypothetical protein